MIFTILILIALVCAIVSIIPYSDPNATWGRIPWLVIAIILLCIALLLGGGFHP